MTPTSPNLKKLKLNLSEAKKTISPERKPKIEIPV